MAKHVNGKSAATPRKAAKPNKIAAKRRREHPIVRLMGEAARADWEWINKEAAKGRFHEYDREFIAAVGKKIVDHDPDFGVLLDRVVKNHGVDSRFAAIIHMDTFDCC